MQLVTCSIGKQLNFHDVSFDNVGGAFVSFDTFLVLQCISIAFVPNSALAREANLDYIIMCYSLAVDTHVVSVCLV